MVATFIFTPCFAVGFVRDAGAVSGKATAPMAPLVIAIGTRALVLIQTPERSLDALTRAPT